MNKTVEAIMNGQEVSTQDLFELVNDYDITSLSLLDGDKTTLAMQVNRFEVFNDVFEFSQECTSYGNKYTIGQKDIVSTKGDFCYITVSRWGKASDNGPTRF